MTMLDTSKQYFARRHRNEIGRYLVEKLKKVSQEAQDGALGMRVEEANAYRQYYGRDMGVGTTTNVSRAGKYGELVQLKVNKSRVYLKAQHALVTGPPVSWKPQSRNSDSNAVKANGIATNLLEDCWKNKRVLSVDALWTEQALVMAQAYVFPEWDLTKGRTVVAEEPDARMPLGRVIKEGDLTFHNVLSVDVFKDERRRTAQSLQWHFVRLQKNRWDLACTLPFLIDGKPSYEKIMQARDPLSEGGDIDDDTAVAYYFFHEACPSLPQGREVLLLGPDCVLIDRPLSYAKPLHRLAADEMFDSPNAWCQFWDAGGAQELRDGIESALASNFAALGSQLVAMEKGTELKADTVANGLRVARIPKGAKYPEGINLVKQPEGAEEHLDRLDGDLQQGFGLNDVAMGQPDSAQMNAQAFAVLASMAAQNAGPFQKRRLDALGELGMGVLDTLRRRVTDARQLQIVGTTNKALFTEETFTGKDLEPVQRVIVTIGNPLEQTPAGRLAMLEYFQKFGLITSVEDVQEIVETGRPSSALRAARDEKLLIVSEYEQLSQGIDPPVHTYQNHPLHYRENAAVLLNPENLKNDKVVNAVQAHCDAHYREYYGIPDADPITGQPVDVRADPLYLDRIRVMLGQPVPGVTVPPMDPNAAPPAEEGAPTEAPPAEGVVPGGPMEAAAPMPTMPTNPLNGGEFSPADGNVLAPPN